MHCISLRYGLLSAFFVFVVICCLSIQTNISKSNEGGWWIGAHICRDFVVSRQIVAPPRVKWYQPPFLPPPSTTREGVVVLDSVRHSMSSVATSSCSFWWLYIDVAASAAATTSIYQQRRVSSHRRLMCYIISSTMTYSPTYHLHDYHSIDISYTVWTATSVTMI